MSEDILSKATALRVASRARNPSPGDIWQGLSLPFILVISVHRDHGFLVVCRSVRPHIEYLIRSGYWKNIIPGVDVWDLSRLLPMTFENFFWLVMGSGIRYYKLDVGLRLSREAVEEHTGAFMRAVSSGSSIAISAR